jgi:hypothetical protein
VARRGERPLGAYRVDTHSVTDMQVALNEIGALYASAACHGGWDKGLQRKDKERLLTIPQQTATPADGAHAFAIVGYTARASSSRTHGTQTGAPADAPSSRMRTGLRMAWIVSATCVTTDLHLEIAGSTTLRVKQEKYELPAMTPCVIAKSAHSSSTWKQRILSNTGEFRTQDSDVQALVTQQLGEARTKGTRRRRYSRCRNLCSRRTHLRGRCRGDRIPVDSRALR